MNQAQVREGQIFHGESLAARYASFVKLPHTLFALPFAGVGAVLASWAAPAIAPIDLVWILVAFTAARFAAMGFNRIVDREYDALNPRTAKRELPAGRLTMAQAVSAVVVASALFVVAAWLLNPLCGWLAPLALAWVFGYSYAKRFTAFAHYMLGLGLGIAPAGAYLALTGAWPQPWYALPMLSAAVMFWVAGFDVIYALQDLDFDRRHGLHSVPARVGAQRALLLARASHATAFLLFAFLPLVFPLGRIYFAGVIVMLALLVYEHRVMGTGEVARLDLARIDRAFFHANVGVSVAMFTFTLLDRVIP
jgi:4-hydroxybenzoate polyprenyltransferase